MHIWVAVLILEVCKSKKCIKKARFRRTEPFSLIIFFGNQKIVREQSLLSHLYEFE